MKIALMRQSYHKYGGAERYVNDWANRGRKSEAPWSREAPCGKGSGDTPPSSSFASR